MIQVFSPPKPYLDFFIDFPSNVTVNADSTTEEKVDFIHIFATTLQELESAFGQAKPNLKKVGMLWISWPKKSSTILTELDKSIVRVTD